MTEEQKALDRAAETTKIPADSPLAEASRKLLVAAYDFFREKNKVNMSGAVHYVTFDNGEMVMFTRGEYKDQLMRNIEPSWPVVAFESVANEEGRDG